MKNIKHHFGIKQTLTLALVASMLVQTFIGVMPAFASINLSVDVGMVNSSNPIEVSPNQLINATYTISNKFEGNGEKWRSSGWYIGNTIPGDSFGYYVCDITPDFDKNSNPPYVDLTVMQAPSAPGLYDAYFVALKEPNASIGDPNTTGAFCQNTSNADVQAIYSIQDAIRVVANRHTLTYNGNTNTSGTAPTSVTDYDGTEVTVSGYGDLAKTNHTFISWNTEAGGDGTNYAVGYKFTISGDTTLYAKWQENQKYTLYYDANGGTGNGPLHETEYVNTVITLNDENSLKKANYTFDGWNTKADGTGTPYSAGASYTITDDVTLYAQWKEDSKYTLSYDGNGSTGGTAPASAEYYEGQSIAVSGKGDLVKTGQTFDGWNTKANGGGTNYTVGGTIEIPGNDVTLYAKWKEATQYTLAYNGNGNTSGTAPTGGLYYDNESVAVSASGNLVRTGYTFAGWNTTADGTGSNYAIGSSLTLTSSLTLYAKWTINSYTITFNSNGGTAIGSKTQEYGTAVTAPATPNRLGYTFAGWSPAIPATMPAFSQMITAQWTVNSYTIYFDEAGGSTVPDITQNYGTTVTAPVNPTRTGFAFAGWLPLVPAAMPAYNQTLTAQWANILVTVTYVAGTGGTISGASTQTINYGADTTAVTATPSTGYTFDKWSDGLTSATRSDLDVIASKTVTATFKTTGEVKGATTDESDVAGATDNANCACWCSCHLFLGISWCWWILIIIIVLAIIIWRVIVAYERRREEE